MVHDWLKRGRKTTDIAKVEDSLRHLKHAVQVNPDAHSGREWAQIEVIEWMRKETLSPTREYPKMSRPLSEARDGLLGLVELGNAWKSVDVFMMVSHISTDDPIVSLFAYLRAQELIRSGQKTLFSMSIPAKKRPAHAATGVYLLQEYARQRKLADEHQLKHRMFAMQQVTAGKLPESDGAYWLGAPSRPPVMVKIRERSTWSKFVEFGMPLVVVAAVLILATYGIFVLVRFVRSRLKR